jgi:CheY-like chemotaxis protein
MAGEAEPRPDKGNDTLAVAAVESQSHDAGKKRILLVDDDERVLTSVALVLEGERYDVILASNGYEAAAQCQRHRPDLIVIDLNMPLKDGWATLETIEGLRPFMPMIVITARPLQYERAIAFGVDALMEKPLDFPVLLAEIDKLLNEPEHERLARLTDQNFRTIKLSSGSARK